MSEKAFTIPPADDRSRHLQPLKGADVERTQSAADEELRAALVTLADCVFRWVGSMPERRDLPDRLWTATQLADWMQIPETTVLEYAREGKIPCVRVGKHVRFDPQAVMQALE